MATKRKKTSAVAQGTAGRLERVEDAGAIIEISEIHAALHELISPNDEEITKFKNSPWLDVLNQIQRRYDIAGHVRDRGQFAPSQIVYYTDIYISICRKYNKAVTFGGLSEFIGVDQNRIQEWGRLREFANSPLRRVYAKVKDASEDVVRSYASDAAARGNGLAMALLANHDHNWDNHEERVHLTDAGPSVDALAVQIAGLIKKKEEES